MFVGEGGVLMLGSDACGAGGGEMVSEVLFGGSGA